MLNRQELGLQLALVLTNTVIITALVAVFALSRYRKAVMLGMQSRMGAALELPQSQPIRRQTAAGDAPSALAWERVTHRRVMYAYMLSIASGALPLAWLYLMQSALPSTPRHVVMVTSIMMVAAVPMIGVALAWPWQRGARLVATVLLAGAALTTAVSALQRLITGMPPNVAQLRQLWTFFAMAALVLALPMTLLLISGTSRLRGIVPIVFAALIVFGAAPWIGTSLIPLLNTTQTGVKFMLATVGWFGLYAPFLALTLPFGIVAWKRLHTIARFYDTKRLSDVQLLAQMWWLIFVAVIAFELSAKATSNLLFTLIGAVGAYVVFPFTNRWLLARSAIARGCAVPRTLLLLRVFGYRSRTERLFDRIGSRWRYFGPVSVIAAPDVVARTIDPADFIGWLTGRVDESFVRTQADLDRRLASFDAAPDPDGRYRVNEFCCSDVTWRATVVSLMDRADAIVMDLRGLTPGRAGAEFELQQLAQRVDAARVVLVVDRDTDRDLLTGPAGREQVHGHVITVENNGASHTNTVFEALLRAAGWCLAH